jgi:hypothetical protein
MMSYRHLHYFISVVEAGRPKRSFKSEVRLRSELRVESRSLVASKRVRLWPVQRLSFGGTASTPVKRLYRRASKTRFVVMDQADLPCLLLM